METVITIISAVAAAYEVASRLIPTTKVWSYVHLCLQGLQWLSSKLDNKK